MGSIDKTERVLLGAFLEKPEMIDSLGLTKEHFFSGPGRAIYATMLELQQENKPVDPITVAARMEVTGQNVIPDLVNYLVELESFSLNKYTLGHYSSMLEDRLAAKQVRSSLAEAEDMLRRGHTGIEARDAALHKLEAISCGVGKAPTLAEEMDVELSELDTDVRRKAQGKFTSGLPLCMGLERIVPTGLPLSVVSVLAGDTKSGKTTVAQNLAWHVASKGTGVIFFTVEDSPEIFRQKMLSARSGIPLEFIVTRRLNPEEQKKLKQTAEDCRETAERIVVDGTPGPSAEDIVRLSRQYSHQKGFKRPLVVIDYLQILHRRGIEREALRGSMLHFQHAAKRGEAAYLVISQLNRGHLQDREDPRPRRQDLYGSGSIEQFSKLIIGIHRPAKFGPPKEGRHYISLHDIPSHTVWEKRLELWILANNKGEENIWADAEWNRPTGRIESE